MLLVPQTSVVVCSNYAIKGTAASVLHSSHQHPAVMRRSLILVVRLSSMARKLFSKIIPYWPVALLLLVIALFPERPKVIPGKSTPVALQKEFNSLPIPAGHLPTNPLSIINRTDIVAQRNFRASSGADEIIEYYRKEIPKFGWVFADYKARPGPRIKFCKGRISLIIEAVPDNQKGTYYYVGVTWSNYPLLSSYCPQQKA